MKDKCQECSSGSSEMILMTKKVDNVNFLPKYYCADCVTTAIRTLNPQTFPKGIRPDARVLKEILDADKMVFERCWDIFNGKAIAQKEEAEGAPKIKKTKRIVTIDNSSPSTIFDRLSESVIGQEDAKRKLALAIRRKSMAEANSNINKINLMLIGPTASGKTELCRVASDLTDAPFVKIDCSHLTPSGYKGVNVDSILLRLYEASKENMARAQTGIVLLDEFDKIIRNGEFSARIQQELLKIIEGDLITFEVDKNKPPKQMDTRGILFIAAGSFPGIERIVAPKKTTISLATKTLSVVNQDEAPQTMAVEARHLIQFGLIPELVGRFAHTATLKKLNTEELYEILTAKKGNIANEYVEIFKEMGHEVRFPEEFLRGIAQQASKAETGARNLKFLMEEALKEYLFDEKGLPESFLIRRELKLSA